MYCSWHHNQSSYNIQPLKVDIRSYRWEISYDLNNTSKCQVESIGSVGIQLIFGTDEVTETDYRPDDTYEYNSDSNGVEAEEWKIWVMYLSRREHSSLQYLMIVFYLSCVIKLFLQLKSTGTSLVYICNLQKNGLGRCEFMLAHTETRGVPYMIENQVKDNCERYGYNQKNYSPVYQKNTYYCQNYLSESPPNWQSHRGGSSHHFWWHLGNRKQRCVVESSKAEVEGKYSQRKEHCTTWYQTECETTYHDH